MDYSDFYYIPQDIAWFIYDIDLGAQKQEKFIRAVWEKEFSFIAPHWRRAGYKVFFQTVSRYFDGCVDVEDKKKDIAYFNSLQDKKSTTFYSENDYINDPSLLKYYYFKERRLKLLFFNSQQKNIFVVKFFLDFWAHDLNRLERIMDFYRLSIYYYSNGDKTAADLATLQDSTNIMYFSISDGEGIYDDFFNEEETSNNEPVSENNNEEEENNGEEFPFDYDMYISSADILYLFNQLNIKQKGKNNQTQFIEYLVANYFGYLYASDNYALSQMVYEQTKKLANLDYDCRFDKFKLLKYIMLYILRTGTPYCVSVTDLVADVKLANSIESLSLLREYLDYYGLACYKDSKLVEVESLNITDQIEIRGVE